MQNMRSVNLKLFLMLFFILSSATLSVSAYSQQQAVFSHPNIKRGFATSSNWSGYAAESTISNPSNNYVKSVTGSWTVPILTCTAGQATYVATWVGIDGYSDSTVEQTGTEQQCSSTGALSYYAWYEMYPNPMKQLFKVNPGDVMTATVTHKSSSSFLLTIKDATTGTSQSVTAKVQGAKLQSAEWIVEAPSSSSGVLPLANFGVAYFTSAQYTTAAGATYAIDAGSSNSYSSITMNDPANGAAATPSTLTDSNGASSFNVVYSAPASSGGGNTYYFAPTSADSTWITSCNNGLFNPCSDSDSGHSLVGANLSSSPTFTTNTQTLTITTSSSSDPYYRDLIISVWNPTAGHYDNSSTFTITPSGGTFNYQVPSGDQVYGCQGAPSSTAVFVGCVGFTLTTFVGSWQVYYSVTG
jgi:hypothetical protein